MPVFDIGGFGSSHDINVGKTEKPVFQENSFDKSIVDDVSPLVKMDVINSHYSLCDLLKGIGIKVGGSNMYCPFHDDKATGKPSAKYHPDSDKLYCFSESKVYSAYHAIKILYGINTDKVFRDLWYKMSVEERHSYMDKRDGDGHSSISVVEKSEWDKYNESVLSYFKRGQVNFKQYKNALFKVLDLVSNSSGEENKENKEMV